MTEIVAITVGDPLMAAAFALRRDVFVVEQGIPEELEVDESDKVATHLVALSHGRVIGTLRILTHGRTARIGRIAVSAQFRSRGIGKALMEFAAVAATSAGAQEIILGAQLTARDFYKRLGYLEEGAVYADAGIEHVAMRKSHRCK
jgi:predicted GNAT family N-acyltransferase